MLANASGVLGARLTPVSRPSGDVSLNAMFSRRRTAAFAAERHRLEQFDLYLYEVMNAPRLQGQIVFEYGTLLRGIRDWSGLRALDVGTGRSTLTRWMSRQGARVTEFDLDAPAEVGGSGFHARVDRLVARRHQSAFSVAGTMWQLPFVSGSFDVVTCLSVLEHLDTEFPARTFVPPAEQQRRLGLVIDEMVRVAAPGGRLYITSECCDYDRATTDGWRSAYYYREGPPLSAAWPVRDVPALFYNALAERGCDLVGHVDFNAEAIADPDRWTSRGPYFSGFSAFARKR